MGTTERRAVKTTILPSSFNWMMHAAGMRLSPVAREYTLLLPHRRVYATGFTLTAGTGGERKSNQ